MAIYNKAKLVVDSVDVSAQGRSLAYNESAEELDDTAFGDDTRSSAGGLIRWTIEAEFNQSFGTATVLDSAFATKVGTVVTCIWRPTTTATALTASNPKYSGSGLITQYVPMTGNVGDQAIASVSIVSAGSRTRAVST